MTDDSPRPPPRTSSSSDDIAASVGAMCLTHPFRTCTRVRLTVVSMKRGSDVSGATSIFVADRYPCRSIERYICACSAYFMRVAGSIISPLYTANKTTLRMSKNAPQSVLNFKISWGNMRPDLPTWPLRAILAEVCFLLKNINASKATGPDGISARMLKETASAIAPSLTILFNCSISQRCFPACWKLANVVPIPKSISQKTSPSGYRPISLLPIVSKIFEKHIHLFISDYLAEYHPIACNQWGFQPQRSCTTTLLTTTYDWYGTMDKGKDVLAVFFDFQKAFDSVPHGPLITKLQNTGLHPHLIMWVKSYLTNRSQRVVVNGSESETIDVISGVPQGSVFGPLLFLIYVNDLCAITLSTGSKVTKYADDLVLHMVVDAETAFIGLQKDIDNIVQWSRSNKVKLNKSKCKVMLFSHKRHAMPPVFIENEQIEQVYTYKYLGVTITPTLKWDEHIDQLCLRAKKLLGYLYRIFYRNVQPSSLCDLFTALIRPILEYASQVWDPYTLKTNIKLKAYRNMHCASAQVDGLLDLFELPTLASRREHLRVMTLHKFHSGHSYLPPDILNLQPATSTRSSTTNFYRIPFARTAQFQHSFLPRTLQVWNHLPYDIIDNDHSSFKCILRHMLL